MKRDYENMLDFEKESFEKFVKAFEDADKELYKTINASNKGINQDKNKMVLFNNDIEQFVDMTGSILGPFKSGELANLDAKVSDLLVSSGRAEFVDES